MRNSAKMAAPTMEKPVNSVIQSNTIHHMMKRPVLILQGLLNSTHMYFEAH